MSNYFPTFSKIICKINLRPTKKNIMASFIILLIITAVPFIIFLRCFNIFGGDRCPSFNEESLFGIFIHILFWPAIIIDKNDDFLSNNKSLILVSFIINYFIIYFLVSWRYSFKKSILSVKQD